MPFIDCLDISEDQSILAIFQAVWNLDGTAWILDLLSVALNLKINILMQWVPSIGVALHKV